MLKCIHLYEDCNLLLTKLELTLDVEKLVGAHFFIKSKFNKLMGLAVE